MNKLEEDKKIVILSNNIKITKDNFVKNGYESINETLKQAILSENLMVLTGAGSSIGEEIAGKTMKQLWEVVKKNVGETEFKTITDSVSYKDSNLEELLSRLQIDVKYKRFSNQLFKVGEEKINKIEEIIKKECTFDLPEDFPHTGFLKKIINAQKKITPRIKIFTLNYDTCFEQAADEIGAVIIDGFSFSQSNSFKTSNFDLDIVYREQTRIHNEENFYHNVFHLYKIHGSVNWEEDKNGKIYKRKSPDKPLLIYPNSSKYENSYQMPFMEMISRFQVALRTQNTVLFIIGYGFGDNHINNILEEAIKSNTGLQVFVVGPTACDVNSKTSFHEKLIQFAETHYGVTLISDDFEGFSNGLPDTTFLNIEDEKDFNY